MFVGGCSGSTAGGMKVSRFVILLKVTWAELRRTIHPRLVYSIKMGGRNVPPVVVGNVTRFFLFVYDSFFDIDTADFVDWNFDA